MLYNVKEDHYMAYISGTCKDGVELQTKIKDALTTNGWTNLKDTGQPTPTSVREMIFQSPDLSVCIGFQSLSVISGNISNYLNLRLNTFDSYQPALAFYSQTGSNINTSNAMPAPLLYTSWSPTKYWIFINERRVIIQIETEVAYAVAYLGKFLPHGSPEQYAKPFFTGGTCANSATGNLITSNNNSATFLEPEVASVVSGGSQSTFSYSTQIKDHLNAWNITRWAVGGSAAINLCTVFPFSDCFYLNSPDDGVVNAYPVSLISGNYTLGILDGIFATETSYVSPESPVFIKNKDGVDEEYLAFPCFNKTKGYKTYHLIRKI